VFIPEEVGVTLKCDTSYIVFSELRADIVAPLISTSGRADISVKWANISFWKNGIHLEQ